MGTSRVQIHAKSILPIGCTFGNITFISIGVVVSAFEDDLWLVGDDRAEEAGE